jgi:hypothetical protein
MRLEITWLSYKTFYRQAAKFAKRKRLKRDRKYKPTSSKTWRTWLLGGKNKDFKVKLVISFFIGKPCI